jgi:hypothetical protein
VLVTGGQFSASARGALVLSGTGALVGIAGTILGIALTVWIVSSSSMQPTGWRTTAATADQESAVPAPAGEPAVEHVQPAQPEGQPERGYWAALEQRSTDG